MKVKSIHGIVVAAALAAMTAIALHPTPRVGQPGAYPPPSISGAINTAVTQANIQQTVCTTGYTATIRPSATYTTALKEKQMKQFGFPGATSQYEEDHFISLELGGNPTDPNNLWPESYPAARAKDQVEDFLHTELCNGTITLAQAQSSITGDWVAIFEAGKARDASQVDLNDI